jgi:hypothetical protein
VPDPHAPQNRPGPVGPPPRPAYSPAPIPPLGETVGRDRRPATLRASAWLWGAGTAAGALGLLTAFVNYDSLADRVTETARTADPDLAADVLDAGVAATLTTLLGASAVLTALVLCSLLLVLRPVAGWRWLLAVGGVLQLFLLPLVLSLVSGGTDVDGIAFLVQGVLVVPALVLLFLRPSGRWLRGAPR